MIETDKEAKSIINQIEVLVGLGVALISVYVMVTGEPPTKLWNKVKYQFDRIHYPCQVEREQAEEAAFRRGVEKGRKDASQTNV